MNKAAAAVCETVLTLSLLCSPAYYVALGVYMCIAKTFITATPYTYLAQDLQACQRYWWQNLLCE